MSHSFSQSSEIRSSESVSQINIQNNNLDDSRVGNEQSEPSDEHDLMSGAERGRFSARS